MLICPGDRALERRPLGRQLVFLRGHPDQPLRRRRPLKMELIARRLGVEVLKPPLKLIEHGAWQVDRTAQLFDQLIRRYDLAKLASINGDFVDTAFLHFRFHLISGSPCPVAFLVVRVSF